MNGGNALGAVTDWLQLVILAIPIVGILLMLWRFGQQAVTWTWRHTSGRPVQRTLAALVGAGCLTMLLMAWLPRHNYRPIQPHERGTVGEGIAAVRYLPQQPAQLDQRATAHDLESATTSTTTPVSPADGVGATTPTSAVTTTSVASGGFVSPSTTTPLGGSVTTVPTGASTTIFRAPTTTLGAP